MLFKIEDKIFNTNPNIFTGVVVAFGLNNNEFDEKLSLLFKNEVSNASTEFINTDIKSMECFTPYRKAFKEFGINPHKFPCSIENILSRISKNGEMPSISPIVDLGNYISLKYKIPVGTHDIDSLSDDLYLRCTTLEDCQNEDNNINGDKLVEGEPVYISGNSVRTRRWLWRQLPAGRVSKSSQNFVFLIDGFTCNKDTIETACNELAELINTLFGVVARTSTVNAENHEVHLGKMCEEEEIIEQQIVMMLKGVAQHTNVSEIREKIVASRKEKRPLRIKLGLDPSAPDIHIGHSVVLRKIKQLQDMGHIAIIIIGDYTGMIGDPTGKSKTRKQMSREDVEHNANTYMEQIFKIISKEHTEVHYNSEWLSKMNFGDVIELSAKCTVARMLERDDFNTRYTNHLPLSIHEFFYPLMQAYDSVAIKADIELGGTDQTFNILMGRTIQKDYGQSPQLALFMPLLEGIDGVEKMSKSLGNYIGISEDASIMYEKTMKIPDDLIIKYYNLCTDVHPDKIAHLQSYLDDGKNPRDVKMMLAHEIIELYAGKDKANQAEERFKAIFQKNQIPNDAPEILLYNTSDNSFSEQLISALINGGYYKSKSEIRRIFMQGGAQINGEKIVNVQDILIPSDNTILKMGKSKFFIIRLINN